jgi:hypothetical protein
MLWTFELRSSGPGLAGSAADHLARLGLQLLDRQSIDVIKMIVAGGYSKVVLLRGRRDPDVIFRN